MPLRWVLQVTAGALYVACLGDARKTKILSVFNTLLTLLIFSDAFAPILGVVAMLIAAKPYVVGGIVCSKVSSMEKLPLDVRIGVAVLGFSLQMLAFPDAATAMTAEQRRVVREVGDMFPYRLLRPVLERGLRVDRVHWLRAALLTVLVAAFVQKLVQGRAGPLLPL